ncbi:MAG: Peptidase family M50 [Firmicutes bacterium ADurb.Bin182]|nr:MAG: Peptidase family M50 [Firmicutes bacterium ADurb.Bin182]
MDFIDFSWFNVPELVSRLIAIVISLAFHEWAHAYSAFKLGDPTARNLGRMTVNPLAHIDLIGFLALIIVRFGWAKPVPINLRNFKNPRRDDIIVSVAGVCTNLLLAFAFTGIGLGFGLIMIYGGIVMTDGSFLGSLVGNFIFINLALFVFNLIPVPPLDGYHVFHDIFIRQIGHGIFDFLERNGRYILLMLLLSGIITAILSWAVSGLLTGMQQIYAVLFGL